jgi:hypothetical protein
VAPTHANARLMRRMQDSNFREVRRVTNLLLKLKRNERKMEAMEGAGASKGVGIWCCRGEFASPNGGVKLPLHQIEPPRLSIMYQKQNGLAMNNEIFVKIYIIENKRVSLITIGAGAKYAGAKNEGNLHYVIEKNGDKLPETCLSIILLKKTSCSLLSIILMKRNADRRWAGIMNSEFWIMKSACTLLIW